MRRMKTVAVIAIANCLMCIVSATMAFLASHTPRRHQGVLLLSSSASYANSRSSGGQDNIIAVQSKKVATMDIREIIALLERTYPRTRSSDDDDEKQRWTKTRKYLYQYRASLSHRDANNNNYIIPSVDHQATITIKRRRRRYNNRGPLTLNHIQRILSFLQQTFPNHPDLQAKILQQSPRILGQYHSIESRLVPTVEFLQGLYGGMMQPGRSNDGNTNYKEGSHYGGMFVEAISRNTDLLLVRGVGYNNAADSRVSSNGSSNTEDDVTGGVLGEDSNDHNMWAVEDHLRQELKVSSPGIAKLKRNHPTLFQLSLNDKVKPVIHYLYSLLLGHQSRMSDSNSEAPASTSPSRTKQIAKQVAKIVTNHPMLLQLDVATNLEPTAAFLRDRCDFTDKELAKVIAAAPGVLGLSVESNLRPTIQFLSNILNSIGRIIGQQIRDNGEGEDEENASKTLLRKCILKHPQILPLSLRNLSAKRDYFDSLEPDNEQGDNVVKKASLAARVLMSAPSTYSLSLADNIIPKLEYLASLWGSQIPTASCTESSPVGNGGGGSSTLLSDNLREYPQILTLSKEGNIIPTLLFYNMTGYINLGAEGLPRKEEQKSFTQQQQQQPKFNIRSRYIATSLYNRLLPRWHFLVQEQEKQQLLLGKQLENLIDSKSNKEARSTPKYIIPTPQTSPPTTNIKAAASLPPLHLLAGASDEIFCRQMKLSLSDYLAFKEEAVPRLKFSSQFDMWLKTGRPIDLTTAP